MSRLVRALQTGALGLPKHTTTTTARLAHTSARQKLATGGLTLPRSSNLHTPTLTAPLVHHTTKAFYTTQGREAADTPARSGAPSSHTSAVFGEDEGDEFEADVLFSDDEFDSYDYDSDMKSLGVSPVNFTKDMLEHGSVVNSFSLEDLMKAKVHYGHHRSMWNPLMEPYLHGVREDIHIFDLEQTTVHLRRALSVLRALAHRKGVILFVGAKPQFETLVRKTALSCGEYFVSKSWVNGALTNRAQTLKADVLPDLIVFLTVPASRAALKESYLLNIPSIGIIDSDTDPFSVTYPIPGNDDSVSAMQLYCNLMSRAVLEGKHCSRHGIPI